MSFNRFVEVGRIALINFGPDAGKLCTIIDVVDGNRALVDGPVNITGVDRQVINFKRLALTDLKVNIAFNARQKKLKAEWEKAGIIQKWEATSWAKKLAARKAKAAQTDFGRFTAMLQKKQVSRAVRSKLAAHRKSSK